MQAIYLECILNTLHELAQMGNRVDWPACEQHFDQLYTVESGRPGLPIRLYVGLQLLKHIYARSDHDILDRWVESSYWQHFCGEVICHHRLPIGGTNMLRFCQRVGEDVAGELLSMGTALGKDAGFITPGSLKIAVIDTTVMPKVIAYSRDTQLVGRCHRQLVILAKDEGLASCQTFCKGLTDNVWQVDRYAQPQ